MSKKQKDLARLRREPTASANTCETATPFVSPEDKALATRGLVPGRRTLQQYLTLVAIGYAKEDVDRWTFHHAKKELDKFDDAEINRRKQSLIQQQVLARLIERDRKPKKPLTRCPDCGTLVRHDRLDRHRRKAHPT